MTVDEYLAKLDPPQYAALERVRQIVKQTTPDATELISYGMPGFKYQGRYLMGYAAFKEHLSLFPTGGPVEALKAKLSAFKLSKGTIQFTLDKPVPEATIAALVRQRMQDIEGK